MERARQLSRIRLLLVSYRPLAFLISARVRVVGAIRGAALSAADDALHSPRI